MYQIPKTFHECLDYSLCMMSQVKTFRMNKKQGEIDTKRERDMEKGSKRGREK